jgi:hypothetical protein|tara:strand:+ start:1565 stop:1855 length:291 start_codon:yes stop_codon:yes gene_type:complete
MKSVSHLQFADSMLIEGLVYTIGENSGRVFHKVKCKGTKMNYGKPMMVFEDQNGAELTINPSYHSYTLEEQGVFPEQSDFNQKGDDNGKTNPITSR